ncbi:MAG: hypothetical protein HKN90_01250 [Flavobacteriaceae bacterium]|nr:hypothetical protein [Flavobacteriaceae bacterium]
MKKLDIHVDTTDMDIAIRFYTKVIGLPLKKGVTGYEIDKPNVHVEFHQKKEE